MTETEKEKKYTELNKPIDKAQKFTILKGIRQNNLLKMNRFGIKLKIFYNMVVIHQLCHNTKHK